MLPVRPCGPICGSWHGNGRPAIDGKDMARDAGGFIGTQKQDRMSDVPHFAHATQKVQP